MMLSTFNKGACLALFMFALSACSSSPNMELVGERRDAIPTADVAIAKVAPPGAELVANLRASYSYGVRATDEDKLRYAIDRVRTQAAQLGANLIVITEVEQQSTSSGVVTGGVFQGQTLTGIEAQPAQVVSAKAFYIKD